ncbi:hypothetical protein CDD83_2627 [Cordyceps sp. RAO-2017]|nr:hypothetical protein CDD83_2627 [Cordyceps sp. RAO-2017]
MVADERRARARLEERVGELERRDAEKRRRLERLEVAMQRIEKSACEDPEERDKKAEKGMRKAVRAVHERRPLDGRGKQLCAQDVPKAVPPPKAGARPKNNTDSTHRRRHPVTTQGAP